MQKPCIQLKHHFLRPKVVKVGTECLATSVGGCVSLTQAWHHLLNCACRVEAPALRAVAWKKQRKLLPLA